MTLVRGEFGGLYGESGGSGFRGIESGGDCLEVMSSIGITSSAVSCSIIAVIIVGYDFDDRRRINITRSSN
jgi:hypothetical protein